MYAGAYNLLGCYGVKTGEFDCGSKSQCISMLYVFVCIDGVLGLKTMLSHRQLAFLF